DAHPGGGHEQDEFLTERVEAAVLEVDRGHHAGGVGLRHRDLVDDQPVGTRIVTEPRQADQAPQVKGRQAGHADQEHPAAGASAHLSRSLTLASARSSRIGKTTAPTVSSDSVTSGAWKTRKRTASSSPYTLSATTWRTGDLIRTTPVAPTATSTSRTS